MFFAAAKSGVILVPFGTKLTPHEIEYIAGDAGLRGFIYDGAFADAVRAVAGTLPWIVDRPGRAGGGGHVRLPNC